jgi:hypothetical protein
MWTAFGILIVVVVVGVVLYVQKTNMITQWLLKNRRGNLSKASLDERNKLIDRLDHDIRDKE